MKNYDLTAAECAMRRAWYKKALEVYESDHAQAAELAAFAAFAGGDSRRLYLDHQNAVKGLVETFSEALITSAQSLDDDEGREG